MREQGTNLPQFEEREVTAAQNVEIAIGISQSKLAGLRTRRGLKLSRFKLS